MSTNEINNLISGALFMGYMTAGLFFFRFWHRTRDRLFVMFAAAFLLLAAQRLGLALSTLESEDLTSHYMVRLLAFLVILVAIIDKNRART